MFENLDIRKMRNEESVKIRIAELDAEKFKKEYVERHRVQWEKEVVSGLQRIVRSGIRDGLSKVTGQITLLETPIDNPPYGRDLLQGLANVIKDDLLINERIKDITMEFYDELCPLLDMPDRNAWVLSMTLSF
jgi:hypothetical protein